MSQRSSAPGGPRVHWFAYIILACFSALLGAAAGSIYSAVMGWWVAL